MAKKTNGTSALTKKQTTNSKSNAAAVSKAGSKKGTASQKGAVSKKGSVSQNGTAKKKPQKPVKTKNGIFATIMPYILIVFALILAVIFITVCLFDMKDDGAGMVGYAIEVFFVGILGSASFVLPLALGYIGVKWVLFHVKWKHTDNSTESDSFFSYEKSHRRLILQTVMTFLVILMLAAMFAVLAADSDPDMSYLTEYWGDDGEVFHGGIFGNFLAVCMIVCFQKIVSLIIISFLLILFFLLMVGLTPDYIIAKIQYNNAIRREERELRQAEYEAQAAQLRLEEQQNAPVTGDREVSAPAAVPVTKSKKARSLSANDIEEMVEEADKPETVETAKVPENEIYIGPSRDMEVPESVTQKETAVPQSEEQTLFRADEGHDYLSEDSFNKDEYAFSVEDIVRNANLQAEATLPKSKPVADEEPMPDIDLSPIGKEELLSDVAAIVPDEGDGEAEQESIVMPYMFPPVDLLKENTDKAEVDYSAELQENAQRLVETLRSFKIGVQEITYSRGPTITRYELRPNAGVRVRAIANLVDDIALNLATSGVRIEAPIPNKPAVGIEVPNRNRATVYLRDLIENPKFKEAKSRLTACLGADVGGNPIYFDISKMPHLLIAGATGMGKSVCINCVIISLLYKAKPDEVKLILIDPKKVEFNIYKDIPHLYTPIVSEPKKAAGALASAVAEMERRFELIEEVGVREINAYNALTENDPSKEYMPHMVIIIDELADLMMTAPDEVESSVCRLAQKARAAGIHIIIGTQRPSVDVITGLIKANVPSRIACTVASQVDSRTIIDIAGAEKLIGRGDMLFAPVGAAKPLRVQGAFVSDSEVENIVTYIRENNAKAKYNSDFINRIEEEAAKCGMGKKGAAAAAAADVDIPEGGDDKFRKAVLLAIETQKISTSLMQRKLGVGYGRAAKLIDTMEEMGYVTKADGNKPRQVRITMEEYMRRMENGTLDAPGDDEGE